MPDPNEQIPVILSRNEWGQIIDGLTCRAEDYEMTARYYGCLMMSSKEYLMEWKLNHSPGRARFQNGESVVL